MFGELQNDVRTDHLYRALCERQKDIPLFNQAWWLDANIGASNWSVLLQEQNGQVIAALPFTKRKFLWMNYSDLPILSQSMGPWFNSSVQPELDYEKRRLVIANLFERLPKFSFFRQNFDFAFDDWMPLYWSGYNQTTLYSHILENIKDHDSIYKNFKSGLKTDLKKAERRNGIEISSSDDIDLFLEVNREVFVRQGRMPPYSDQLVRQVDAACQTRSARDIFVATDPQGNVNAAVYIVYDHHKAHYLMGGARNEYRNSAALSLCLWHAIRYASNRVDLFNFKGSMMRPVEKFFRSFGGRPKPYFALVKSNGPFAEAMAKIALRLDARK